MYDLLFSLIIGVIYLAVVGLLLYWVKPKSGKALVLIAAILIPNADHWYYQHELAQYCKNEAGFKVHQQVSHREGFANLVGWYRDDFTAKNIAVGYVEWPEAEPNGTGVMVTTYWRSDRLPDGSSSKPYRIANYSAPYELVRLQIDTGQFIESTYQIKRRSDNYVIANFSWRSYYGSWFARAVLGRGGLVAGCGEGGQMLTRQQWVEKDSGAYDDGPPSLSKFINQTFTAN